MQRTAFGQRQSVQHEGSGRSCALPASRARVSALTCATGRAEYLAHCYLRRDGLAGVVVTDKEYPRRVAFSQLGLLMEEFVRVHAYVQRML